MGINRPIDITAEQRKTVLALLARYLPNTTAWVHGSRVKWTARPQSDLDLVVFATPEQAGRVSDLREAFEESNLAFRVDLFVWDEVPEQFRKTIEAEHVVLVERRKLGVGSEWREMTLGDVCDFVSGSVFKLKYQGKAAGKYPFIKVSDMNLTANGFCIHKSNNWIDQSLAQEIKARPLPTDAIVFAKIGEALKQNRLRMTVRPTIIDNNMMGAVPKTDIVDPRFLFYGMHQFDFGEIASGTALPYLTVSTLADLPLALPPLPKQQTIAHILGTLDDKIELNRRMNQTLEEMARALFKSWFVDFDPVRAKATLKQRDATPSQGGSDWSVERARAYLNRMDPNIAALFPDRFVDSELGPIPEGWEMTELGELVELAYGKALKAENRKSGAIPVYGSNGQVGWHAKELVVGPGIVVGRKGNPGVVTWV